MTSATDEIRAELMEHKAASWKAATLAASISIALLGGCSTIQLYALQQQSHRIEANAKQASANCAKLTGMRSDILWIRDALNRIELRQSTPPSERRYTSEPNPQPRH